MNFTLSIGHNTCPHCGKEFIASEVRYPDRDVKHDIGCPYCDATVGYASGTIDIETLKLENMQKPTNVPNCPKCGRPMKKRINSHTQESFWGCSAYPHCDGTR